MQKSGVEYQLDPVGVGSVMKPPQYLKAGDVMELDIEGLGLQRQTVVPFTA